MLTEIVNWFSENPLSKAYSHSFLISLTPFYQHYQVLRKIMGFYIIITLYFYIMCFSFYDLASPVPFICSAPQQVVFILFRKYLQRKNSQFSGTVTFRFHTFVRTAVMSQDKFLGSEKDIMLQNKYYADYTNFFLR
jgi:hypothetical protein